MYCNGPSVCLFVCLFVGPPYYSQRAVFASPLSAFFVTTVIDPRVIPHSNNFIKTRPQLLSYPAHKHTKAKPNVLGRGKSYPRWADVRLLVLSVWLWFRLGGDKAATSDNYRDFDSAIDCSAAEWLALRGACVAASWRHTHSYKLISRRCSEMIGAEMTSLCCCCCCSCGVASLLDGPNPSASVDEFSSCCCFYVRREINNRMRR